MYLKILCRAINCPNYKNLTFLSYSNCRIFFGGELQKLSFSSLVESLNTKNDDFKENNRLYYGKLSRTLKNDPKYSDYFYNSEDEPPQLQNKCQSLKILKQFFTDPNSVELTKLQDFLEEDVASLTFHDTVTVINWFLSSYEKDKANKVWLETIPFLKMFTRSLRSKNEEFKALDVLISSECNFLKPVATKILLRLSDSFHQLTPQEFVLTCMYNILFKNKFKQNHNFIYKEKFKICVPDLSCKEINIPCQLFEKNYKCYIPIEICKKILEKINEEIENYKSFECDYLVNVLCKQRNITYNSEKLQNTILSCISSLNLCSLINLALLMPFDEENKEIFLNLTINKCLEEFSQTSDYNIKRVLSLMAEHNIRNEDLVNKIVLKCEKYILSENYNTSHFLQYFVVKTLFTLMHIQVYPKNLLNHVMTEEFCKYLLKNKIIYCFKYFYFLNCSLAVENPSFHCDFSPELKRLSSKVFYYTKQTRREYNKWMYQIEEKLKSFYGENKFFWVQILSHYKNVIVMRFDKSLKAQDIPEEFKSMSDFVKKPTDNDHFWMCLYLTDSKGKFFSTEIKGSLNTFTRQSKAIGYLPVEIHLTDWVKHIKTKNQEHYLHDLLTKELHKIA